MYLAYEINFSCGRISCTEGHSASAMSLVKPLFVASIASLTLMMTSMGSTIKLLQQMGILPSVGTCCNCSSPTGAFKSEGLYNYFRCCNCKRKQSLLHDTVLSNSNTTLRDFVLLMYQFCNSHRTYDTVTKETCRRTPSTSGSPTSGCFA